MGVGCVGQLEVVFFGLFVVGYRVKIFLKAFSAGTFLSSKFGRINVLVNKPHIFAKPHLLGKKGVGPSDNPWGALWGQVVHAGIQEALFSNFPKLKISQNLSLCHGASLSLCWERIFHLKAHRTFQGLPVPQT